nr:hypothetical protein [Novosphingobium panipatense]
MTTRDHFRSIRAFTSKTTLSISLHNILSDIFTASMTASAISATLASLARKGRSLSERRETDSELLAQYRGAMFFHTKAHMSENIFFTK